MKNTEGYKVYNGLDGVAEWLDFLLTMEFPDFAVEEMVDGEVEGTVTCKVSYTPYCKATMKVADKKMSDTQLWTVKEGKVTPHSLYDSAGSHPPMLIRSSRYHSSGPTVRPWTNSSV